MSIEITGGTWKEKYDKLQEVYLDLESERDALQDRLDQIAEIASPDAASEREQMMERIEAIPEAIVKAVFSQIGPALEGLGLVKLPTGTD